MQRRKFTKAIGGSLVAGLAGIGQSVAANTASKLAAPEPIDSDKGIGKEGWSIVVIPDTQNYAKFMKNQPNFDVITEWISEHIEPWNVQAVLHEGDYVEQNAILEGGGRGWGDQDSTSQWQSAQHSMKKLYAKVPTILATGNHDYGVRNAENRETRFNNYFGLTDNPLTCDGQGGGIWREGFPNSFGATTLENSLYTFNAPDGKKILIISLEWSPRKAVVDWAKKVLNKPEYIDHLGILLTHCYLQDDNTRNGERSQPGNPHKYPTGKGGDAFDGEDLWKALVKDAPQLQFVMNGHEMGRHVGYRNDQAKVGHDVHQMLFNAQGLGGGSREKGNGGDGWIRILTFDTDGKHLAIRTFSPLREKQGKSKWNLKPDHHFRLRYS